MSFVRIPNGVRIVHLGHVGQQQIVNTIGCQNGAGLDGGASLAALAKSHGDAWRSKILPQLSNVYTHDATLAYSLEDQSAAVGDAGYSAGANGGLGGNPAPLAACAVISFKTAKRGRTYAGRTFMSPLVGANLTGGLMWSAEQLAVLQTQWAGYKAAVDPGLATNNGRMAVCSAGSPSHGIAPHVEPVTSIIVRPVVGTQRRRLS